MRPAGAFAIVPLDDVPIAGGRLVGSEPEQRFEKKHGDRSDDYNETRIR